ncbi:MAG: aldose 1-epimerase family protein [Christensenella sp.]|uniref:aldose 1-epimerase family protein n=1 Tax=Christensenella sp. TaxID=1935934 RepID=UPI002B1EDA7A|nr:aldose 1-epimerase family protein [Christensenella sp.]MEA5003320.1 aldose 1-epimerase family protein [Christensenella sp.]
MNLTYQQTRPYIGHDYQTFGVRSEMLLDGKETGVKLLRLKNGAQLQAEVLCDRGLSLGEVTYKGINLSFLSHTGVVAPTYYVENGKDGFYKNFFGGMMMSCGMTHMGAPCDDAGKSLGLHGPMPCTPAEEVCACVEDKSGTVPEIVVRGKLRQSEVYAEHLMCERTIRLKYGENKISIHDDIKNEGFEKQPFMLLYHFNFGYPLISEHTKVFLAEQECTPRDEIAKNGFDTRYRMDAPGAGRPEECYFCRLRGDADDNTTVVVENEALGLAAALKYNTLQLPFMTEWKSMMAGDYALGVNPGVYTPMGRAHARKNGMLLYIEPDEVKSFDFELSVSDDASGIKALRDAVNAL